MPFLLYTDAQMTTEAISPFQLDFNGRGKQEIKLYFGSPDPNERLTPKTDDKIMLAATSRLKNGNLNTPTMPAILSSRQ